MIGEALPEGPATIPGDIRFGEALALLRYAAGLSLDAGDLPSASAWIETHDRWLAWSGGLRWRAEGQLLWARVHRAAGDPELAVRHAIAALERAT
ncbi:MAG: hypothetical protein H0U10_17345 [Chloroflexia bacterium]|nr:hypothetical protein [Chloroflexia bacterium]